MLDGFEIGWNETERLATRVQKWSSIHHARRGEGASGILVAAEEHGNRRAVGSNVDKKRVFLPRGKQRFDGFITLSQQGAKNGDSLRVVFGERGFGDRLPCRFSAEKRRSGNEAAENDKAIQTSHRV